MSSRKSSLILLTLLALTAAAGWHTGARAAKSGTVSHAGDPGVSTGPEAPETSVSKPPGAGSEAADPAKPDTAAAKAELMAILNQMNEMDDEGPGGGLLQMWVMARAFNLTKVLSPAEWDAVIEIVPEKERADLKMALQYFGSMMIGMDGQNHSGKPADFAQELKTEAEKKDGMQDMVLMKWIDSDPVEVLRHWKSESAKADPPAWVRDKAEMLFGQMSLTDPRLALREALSVTDEKLRQSAVNGVNLRSLYRGGKNSWPADGDELVKQQLQATPETRQRLLGYALGGRLQNEAPQETAAWIDSLNLGPDSRSWTDRALVEAWRLNGKSVEAGNWLLTRTAPEARATAVEEMVTWWTQGNLTRENRQRRLEPDIAACADWILSLGIGPDTEKGISRLADGWINSGEPAAALAWAQAIKNPDARQSTLDNVTTQIRRRYPDTWRAMLTAAGLPAASPEPANPAPAPAPVSGN